MVNGSEQRPVEPGATGRKYIVKAVKWDYKAAQTYKFKRNYNRMSIANKYSY